MKDATRYHRPFNSLPLDRLLTTLREKRKASGNILGKEESACIIIMLFSFFFLTKGKLIFLATFLVCKWFYLEIVCLVKTKD